MTQHSQDISQSIAERISRWKNAFQQAVVCAGGQASSTPADRSTYADILCQGGKHVTYGLIDQTITRGTQEIGSFKDDELLLLHSGRYWDARTTSMNIFSSYDDENFRLQATKNGPVIACPRAGSKERLAFIFHAVSPSFRMLEAFYETGKNALVTLPETFVSEGGHFYTVKAIRNLNDHPLLAKRISELGL